MKITAKEIDLLVDSMMDKVYDRNYVTNETRKLAEKEWEKMKKRTVIKEFLKLIDNDYFYSIIPSQKIYEELGLKKNCYDNMYGKDSFENWVIGRLAQKYKVDYPNERDVKKELKNMLVIECLGGDNLKEVLGAVIKEIKKKFKLS